MLYNVHEIIPHTSLCKHSPRTLLGSLRSVCGIALATSAIMLSGTYTMASAADTEPAGRLVLMHTNDTHSQIDPLEDGTAGILRRKVLVDSIRAAEPNSLLIDAGDVVQGTLFFTLYGGEVENRLVDSLGYDYRILGNHEFDNGTEALAEKIRNTHSTWITTNYDLSGSALEDRFVPYDIRCFEGRKIGFIGINLRPEGMISEGNYDGVKYLDMQTAANSTAWHLKHNEKVDLVVALTHIGYAASGTGTSDIELAACSHDIDIIIGAHSHTLIDPANPRPNRPWRVPNADGDTILVTQTGKSGINLGLITIDLGSLKADYRLIPVDSRLDSKIDQNLAKIIEPYRAGVDSLMNVPIARSARALTNRDDALLNFVADYIKMRGDELYDDVDFAITNKGGIRKGLPKGGVSEGMIINMLPFNNKIEVLEIKGSDLLENFDIMAQQGGNGVSKEVHATYDASTHKCTQVLINGKAIDPDKVYHMATIDYLANGGDYMKPLTRSVKVAVSPSILSKDLIKWLQSKRNYKIDPPSTPRFVAK